MDEKNQITEGVIWKQLLIFFFPIVIGTFFQQIYNTADSIVVGRFVGKEALAAVGGSVNQIVNLIKNTSCLYIIGGADLISLTYSFVTGENTGGAYAPAYLVSGLLFFIICYPLSKTASAWEIHLKKRDQRVTFQKTEGQVTDNE